MSLIAICLAFISLTGGMFLLAKTNKDALNVFYRIVAWFIIVSSLVIMTCAAMHCMMKLYGKSFHYEMMMQEKHGKKMNKMRMKGGGMYHHKMKNKDCCEEEMNCRCRDKSDCCETDSPRRYWERKFNDSCVRIENRKNK